MGAKKIEIEIISDGETSVTVDGKQSPFVDSLGSQIHQAIYDCVDDHVSNAELPKCSDDGTELYYTTNIKIDLTNNKIEAASDIQYTADDDMQTENYPYDIPSEYLKGQLPKAFTIDYSGSGDDGGINGIEYDGDCSTDFQNWIEGIADSLIPSDANFNNEGSFGHVYGKIKGKKLKITTELVVGYTENTNIGHDITLDDINVEIEI